MKISFFCRFSLIFTHFPLFFLPYPPPSPLRNPFVHKSVGGGEKYVLPLLPEYAPDDEYSHKCLNLCASLHCKCRAGYLREAAKKVLILVAMAIKALPPPSSLMATNFFPDFFFELQKKLFFLSVQAFTHPLLVVGPLKKDFLRRFLFDLLNQSIFMYSNTLQRSNCFSYYKKAHVCEHKSVLTLCVALHRKNSKKDISIHL